MSLLQRPELAYELTAEGIYDKPLMAFIDVQKEAPPQQQEPEKPVEQLPEIEGSPGQRTGLEAETGTTDEETCSSDSDEDRPRSWDDPKMSVDEKRAARKEHKKKVKEEKREARKTKIPKAEKKKRKKLAKAKCSR